MQQEVHQQLPDHTPLALQTFQVPTQTFRNQFNSIELLFESFERERERVINSQKGLIGDDELSKGAEGSNRTNRVADFELGDGGSHGVDDAGVIGAGDERKRWFLLVLAQYL